jgi:hypothetical protein
VALAAALVRLVVLFKLVEMELLDKEMQVVEMEQIMVHHFHQVVVEVLAQ